MTTEPPSPPPGETSAAAETPDDQRVREAATAGADAGSDAASGTRPGAASDTGPGADSDAEPVQRSGPTVQQTSVGRAGAVMAAGSLVSRLVGLARAALLIGVIGTTGYAADAFTTANNLPNQFYLLIAGGTLNAVLVPQIVRAKLRPDGDEFVN